MRRFRWCARRFARDDDGTITIEFMLTFPLLVMWLVGSYVFFDVFKSESKASKAGYALADIVSRQTSVTVAELNDYYLLLDKLLPRASDDKWMRISSIYYDTSVNDYRVRWSHVSSPDNSILKLSDSDIPTARMPDIAEEDSIIYLEIEVPYQPIITTVGFTDQTWRPQVIVRPRFIDEIACSDCS